MNSEAVMTELLSKANGSLNYANDITEAIYQLLVCDGDNKDTAATLAQVAKSYIETALDAISDLQLTAGVGA